MTAKRTTTTAETRTDLFDALTMAIERADSLTGLIEQRLTEIVNRPDSPNELYALSLVAAAVSDEHQQILDNARALFTSQGKVTR
jgi:hypothetical protein